MFLFQTLLNSILYECECDYLNLAFWCHGDHILYLAFLGDILSLGKVQIVNFKFQCQRREKQQPLVF